MGAANTCSTECGKLLTFCSRSTLTAILFFVSGTSTVGIRAQAVMPAIPVTGAQNEMKAIAQNSIQSTGDYVIGPDDLLNVYVLDVPELSREYRVSNSGTVALPVLAKPLTAAGLTLGQFSEKLSQELLGEGLVSDPHVTASVVQSTLHSVAVTGAVRRPQVYLVLTQTTLLDVLSQAEGLTDDAGSVAVVSRGSIAMRALADSPNHGEKADTFTVNLRRLLETGDPTLNPVIYPGDRITVPRAGVVYVVGAVNKPGRFSMNADGQGMTVLQAIALAEDTKNTASKSLTVILRSDAQAKDGRDRIMVNLKAVLQGKQPDPKLRAEDIVFVPESTGKRALNRGIESIVEAATGVAIYGSHF
jgi:polysaccharide biosynthesis/export protein